MENSIEEQKNKTTVRTIQIAFSVLFFMWGLLTVLNFVLIEHLAFLFQLSYSISTLINLTFFSTYLIVSLKAGSLIKRVGYKRGIIIGWLLSCLGCFVFAIAVYLRSYNIFLPALFILASGITILQVGANLYVVLYGDSKTAGSRLNLIQGFNSLGTFLAPSLVFEALWAMVNLPSDSRPLIPKEVLLEMEAPYIHLPYLFLGILMALFAIYLIFANIPQINIEKMEPLNKMRYHRRNYKIGAEKS